MAALGRFWLTEEACCVAVWVSLHFVRFKAQLLFCLPALPRVSVSCRRQEAGGRRRSVENEHLARSQTLLGGSWPGPGAWRRPAQAALSLQAFPYTFSPSKRMKRLGGAFPVLGTFPKSPLWAEKPGGSSGAKKGRGQLCLLSHSFPVRCLI